MASWGFGILLILAGLGSLTMSVPAAIIYFITGIFLIPNVRQGIDDRLGIKFSRWVVVLIAFVGIGLGAAITQDSTGTSATTSKADNQQEQPTQDSNNQQNESEKEEQPSNKQVNSENEQESQNTKESRTHSIGDEFTVGDVRYQVNGVKTRKEIGERSYGTLIGVEADGKFILVDMTVMNEANEAIRMRESSLKLMIDEAEYSTSSEAWAYMEDSFTFEQLNPGVQVDGNVAYDVPESADTDSMELRVSPVGLFSMAEPHYVGLAN
ncbi:MAG: hypothetical protein BRC29_03280 [Nanohaloarchaea archaeon SW_7_43_1]|nr:MAG: hypothetical protein BRC29_03280 [Nanohaloarchaea archaeon SW_7_43_1]